MRIDFDRGTLLIEGPTSRVAALPGVEWDPRVGRFRAPARFHAAIRTIASEQGDIDDRTVAHEPPRPSATPQPTLRPYQQAALHAWELCDRRAVIVMPTGAGKSRVGCAAIARVAERALVLVPTRVLLDQWHETLRTLGIGGVGRWGDGKHELAPITVATYEGALRAIDRLGNRFELLVVDEVHHFGVGARDEILEMTLASARLGLTATMPPPGAARDRLTELVGPLACELSVEDLAGRYLAQLERIVVHLRLHPGEQKTYDAEMAVFRAALGPLLRAQPGLSWPEIVSILGRSDAGLRALAALRAARRVARRSEAKLDALGRVLEQHRDRRVLVFTADNDTAYEIARRFLIMPITCDIARDERDRVLALFRSGALRALVSSRVLNEGIDVPEAEVAVIVGASLGEREHVQRVGRVLRPAPGKTALVYELVTDGTSERRQARERARALGSGWRAR
ncbi:MAG: DEAD/DEAH box helicase family protein [Myxococcota bacterium]|nr:DEAD/DEAH box helicase family protein [Myxococcota bacterium]